MSPTGLVFFFLSIIICIVDSDKSHLKKEPICGEKTRRLLECVYSCIQHADCGSLDYKTISAKCYLHTANTQNSSGALSSGNLTELFNGRGKKISHQATQISTQHKRRILLRGTMTWRKAGQACREKLMIQIRNEIDQATAVKIVNGSGLESVAIGAYRSHFEWQTKGGYNKLLFSDWAENEPGSLDSFAGLSRRSGYKWEGFSLFHRFDGVLCEF